MALWTAAASLNSLAIALRPPFPTLNKQRTGLCFLPCNPNARVLTGLCCYNLFEFN